MSVRKSSAHTRASTCVSSHHPLPRVAHHGGRSPGPCQEAAQFQEQRPNQLLRRGRSVHAVSRRDQPRGVTESGPGRKAAPVGWHGDSRAAQGGWDPDFCLSFAPTLSGEKPEQAALSSSASASGEMRKEDKRGGEWTSATRTGPGSGQRQRLLNGWAHSAF